MTVNFEKKKNKLFFRCQAPKRLNFVWQTIRVKSLKWWRFVSDSTMNLLYNKYVCFEVFFLRLIRFDHYKRVNFDWQKYICIINCAIRCLKQTPGNIVIIWKRLEEEKKKTNSHRRIIQLELKNSIFNHLFLLTFVRDIPFW